MGTLGLLWFCNLFGYWKLVCLDFMKTLKLYKVWSKQRKEVILILYSTDWMFHKSNINTGWNSVTHLITSNKTLGIVVKTPEGSVLVF